MAPWEGLKLNAPLSAGLAFMIVPIYDTIRIFIKRTLKGKSPLKPDKSHVHHFLLRMGLKHDQVALVLGTVKLMFIALVFFGFSLNDHILVPTIALMAAILGNWMDKKTLKSVKVHCKNAPKVTERRSSIEKKKVSNKTRHSISEEIF